MIFYVKTRERSLENPSSGKKEKKERNVLLGVYNQSENYKGEKEASLFRETC